MKELGLHQDSEESLRNGSIQVLVFGYFIIKFLTGSGKGSSMVICELKWINFWIFVFHVN